MTTGGAEVRCDGVMHLFAGEDSPVVALRNVDLDVEAGELLAILGPSGSGKTTLLSLLSGLLRPTAGTVLVAGHDVGRMGTAALTRLRATELALLLQEPGDNLLPYATAIQNVRFAQRGARRRHWPRRWTAAEALSALGLDQLGDRPMSELSGGQQQQVAVATVLAASPRVLLADEPTAHLDSEGRDAVLSALQDANRLSGATTIVVTHDPLVAAAMRRTVTISNGHVGAIGRGGRQFVVIGRDGTVQLPAEVLADHPAGTLLSVHRGPDGINLRPEPEPEP